MAIFYWYIEGGKVVFNELVGQWIAGWNWLEWMINGILFRECVKMGKIKRGINSAVEGETVKIISFRQHEKIIKLSDFPSYNIDVLPLGNWSR